MKIKEKLFAPAKINLGLQVLEKREDNYHNINTVFAKVSLFDIIHIETSSKIIVNTDPNFNIPNEVNLVTQAIKKFNFEFKKNINLKVNIEKHIPIGAGLGGGSSNAATILKFLHEIYKDEIKLENIVDIAKGLGADIPFFLKEGTCLGKGIGERLEKIEIETDFDILIVTPNIHISTPSAYKSLSRGYDKVKEIDLKSYLSNLKENFDVIRKNVINDFEAFAFSEYPELGKIKDQLYKFGADFALMSGSGSSLFGIFTDKEKAKIAKENIPFKCHMTSIIS